MRHLAGLVLLVACAGGVSAQEVVRHRTPGSTFPIAAAVEVPPGMTTIHVSGTVPRMIEGTTAPRDSVDAFGDTKTQTVSVLGAIAATLTRLNLTMGDVVKMQVFLVGDPGKAGVMDFAGFMEGYTQFFGTAAQPNLPARSVMRVAGLVNPGWLVEIEVTAAARR